MTTTTPDTDLSCLVTPLVTLPDGTTILGNHDSDGSPLTVLAETDAGDYLYCDADGNVTGVWAGADIDCSPAQVLVLRDLFTGPLLATLHDAALQWHSTNQKPIG